MMCREPVSNSGKKTSPNRCGSKFSDSGFENLRFGKLSVDVDKVRVYGVVFALA